MAAFAFAEEETAVFAETSLGTRIVMTVPVDIKAADFKRKLEKTHSSCFSSLGEIRVHALMVKRRSHIYYIAESVPINYVFRDNQKPWFIHADTRVVNRSQEWSLSNSIDKESQIRRCSASDDDSIEGVSGLLQGKNHKTNKPGPKSDGQTCAGKRDFLGPSTSEPETVTPKTPGNSVISRKLMVAANNIRMQGKTSDPTTLSSSIIRSKIRRKRSLNGNKVTSLAKFMVFEIPDTED